MTNKPVDGGPRCRPGTSVPDRLMRYLEWRGDCLEWTGSRDHSGYGQIGVDGRRRVVTRVIVELNDGPIPDGLHVCHACDNPPCCNPDHLFLGTRSDNLLDCYRKGRAGRRGVRGADNAKVRHDDALVTAAIALRAAGMPQRAVAKRFGVSQSTVWRWTHGLTRGVAA